MYFETSEGFAGQRELINKFGLEIREDTTFVIAKRSWQNQVDNPMTQIVEGRPNEGDIIYFPLMNSFFEIQFVEDQQPFFQLGNLPVYKFRVTRWEYSSEELNRRVDEIDDKEDVYSLSQEYFDVCTSGEFTDFFNYKDVGIGSVFRMLSVKINELCISVQNQNNLADNFLFYLNIL
jgi:hypothetical protein